MTIVEFLTARLADPVAQGNPHLECEGAGEYYRCDEWSDWHRRTVDAQLKVVDYMRRQILDAVEHYDADPKEATLSATCANSTLRALAAVYADHPEYNPEWK